MGWGDLPDLTDPGKRKKKKRGRGRVSPTGPYRAESGNKKIRSKASSAERRRFSRGSTPTATRARKLERKDRRDAAQAKRDAAKATTAVTKAKASRPIETLRKAEAKLERREDPKLREATRRLRHALASEAAFKAERKTPEGAPRKANEPEKALRSVAPRAYRKALKSAEPGGHGSSRGLGEPEDLTTAITLAAPGGGLAGRAVAKGLEAGGERVAAALGKRAAEKVASETEQSAAQVAGKSAAKRIKVKAGSHVRARGERVKSSPKRAVRRAKETPRRVREAPARARRAATTKAGRRAAAKRAARSSVRHPIRSGAAGLAVLPVKPEGGGVLPGDPLNRLSAFGKGELAAAVGHPGKYAETTAHAGLGALAYPLVLGGAGVESVKSGSPKPLIEQGERAVEGTKKMIGDLASGDAKRVERSALQETGAVPFIPVPAALRRLKGTKAYEDARAAARAAVEGKRAPKREAAIAADRKAQETGDYRSRKSQRKIKRTAAVPDTARPGEHYVNRRLGRGIEKQRSRHRIAREFARITHEESQARKAVEEIAKPLRKSKGATQKDVADVGTALRIVGRYGLPHDEAKGMAFVERLHGGWEKGEPGKSPGGVALDRHATAYIISHPEIFRNPKFWEGVARLDKLQKEVATSPRHQFMAQLDQLVNPIREEAGKHRLLKPEEMVTPEALKLLPKRDAGGLLPSQVKELQALKELERRGQVPKGAAPKGGHLAVAARPKPVGEWSRSEAFDYLKELRQGSGRDQARAAALQNALEDAGGGRRLMAPPEHGGAEGGVSTTRAVPWTSEMLQRHLKQIRPELKRLGLREPTPYLADVLPSKMPGGEPSYGTGLPRAVHASQGLAAKSGNAIADFDQALHHSAVLPRRRRAMVTGLNRVFDHFSRKVAGHRYLTRSQVEKAINNHEWPPGTVPVRTQMLRSLLEGDTPAAESEFKQALEAELEHGQALVGGGKEELRAAMEAAKEHGVKGDKFAPMDAVAINELMGHLEGPGAVTKWAGHGSNFATRTILNSPAFEVSQFFQEGIPGAIALGRDIVHIPKAVKQIEKINELPVAEQNRVRAVMGASVGLRGAPNIKETEGFLDPVRSAAPKQVWRHAWELVNGSKISRFDIARSGKFREVAALARIEGDFRRSEKGFQGWRHSSRNLFKNESQAIKDMKGMDGGERALYIAEHPRLGDNIVKDMRGILGNWDAFTVFEKHIAPFAIFYPFQRFSALWTLYHFPLDHPAAATSLAMLGAVNAAEVKRAAELEGGTPSVVDYTKPVINGRAILPAGQRFSAGLGSIQSAILEHKPMQALQGLNPALGLPIEALSGKNAYTDQPIGENGFEYLARQAANLSPFSRFLGLPDVGKGAPSPGSQAFAEQDPLKQQRSLFDPLIGQSVKQFAKEKRLEKDFKTKYGEGAIPGPFDSQMVIDLLYGGKGGNPQPELLPHVIRRIHEAERAGNRVKRAEAPYLPKSKDFSQLQTELLQAVEDAWQTGPESTSGGKYAGALAKKPLPGQGKYGGAFKGASTTSGKYAGSFGQ
jgi:hypothetical protein